MYYNRISLRVLQGYIICGDDVKIVCRRLRLYSGRGGVSPILHIGVRRISCYRSLSVSTLKLAQKIIWGAKFFWDNISRAYRLTDVYMSGGELPNIFSAALYIRQSKPSHRMLSESRRSRWWHSKMLSRAYPYPALSKALTKLTEKFFGRNPQAAL